LELIFGVDSFKNGKWLNEFHNSNLKCTAEESIWEVFENVNNDVLFELKQIIQKNPGCTQFMKCELSYFVPKSIKKFFPGWLPESQQCSREKTKCPLL